MKSALEVAGYLVELYLDLDRIGMKTVLKKLRERATNGCIVLVYYSGHGHSIHAPDIVRASTTEPISALRWTIRSLWSAGCAWPRNRLNPDAASRSVVDFDPRLVP